jgi:hypothetical protein
MKVPPIPGSGRIRATEPTIPTTLTKDIEWGDIEDNENNEDNEDEKKLLNEIDLKMAVQMRLHIDKIWDISKLPKLAKLGIPNQDHIKWAAVGGSRSVRGIYTTFRNICDQAYEKSKKAYRLRSNKHAKFRLKLNIAARMRLTLPETRLTIDKCIGGIVSRAAWVARYTDHKVSVLGFYIYPKKGGEGEDACLVTTSLYRNIKENFYSHEIYDKSKQFDYDMYRYRLVLNYLKKRGNISDFAVMYGCYSNYMHKLHDIKEMLSIKVTKLCNAWLADNKFDYQEGKSSDDRIAHRCYKAILKSKVLKSLPLKQDNIKRAINNALVSMDNLHDYYALMSSKFEYAHVVDPGLVRMTIATAATITTITTATAATTATAITAATTATAITAATTATVITTKKSYKEAACAVATTITSNASNSNN